MPKDIELNPNDEAAVVAIVAGLLASGHFTYSFDEDAQDPEPGVIRWDAGEEWKEHEYSRRWPAVVVEEAKDLLTEIKRGLANGGKSE